jgi:hypothetical protein
VTGFDEYGCGDRIYEHLRRNLIGNLVRNCCPQCHKLIDDQPKDYTRRALSEYKRRHEKWIKQATGLSPERKTAVSDFSGRVGDRPYKSVGGKLGRDCGCQAKHRGPPFSLF